MASASCGSPTDVPQESCQVSAVDLTVKQTAGTRTCQDGSKVEGAFPGAGVKPHIVGNEQHRVSANVKSFQGEYKKNYMSTHTVKKVCVNEEDKYSHKLYKYVKMQTGNVMLQENTIDKNAYICSEASKMTHLSEHMKMQRASRASDSYGSPTDVPQESCPVSAVDLTVKQTAETEARQDESKKDAVFADMDVKPNIVGEVEDKVSANLEGFQEGSKLYKDVRIQSGNVTLQEDTADRKAYIYSAGRYEASRIALTEHIEIHTGEEPQKCEQSTTGATEPMVKHTAKPTGEEKLHGNTTDRKAYIYSAGGSYASRIALLSEHVEIHTREEPQQCDQSTTGVIEPLVKHTAKPTGEETLQGDTIDRKAYIYSVGGYGPSRIALLSERVEINTGEEARKCEQSPTSVIEPLVKHTGDEKLEESNTDRNVYNSGEASKIAFLSEHMNLHPEEVPQECDQSTSDTTEPLVKHAAKPTGEKPFVCKECGFRTVTKSRLARHLMVHTGEKPHMCDRCGFRTAEKGKLNQHLKTHTGERVYKCNQCDYSASQTSDLNNHMAKHTGELPYKCKECEYRTVKMSNLAQHMKVHTGEKPYRCDQCDFRTAWKRSFDLHMAKHSGEKPFVCGECGYRTHNRSNIAQHMKVHSGEKAFKCEQCDYCSSLKGNLDRHMAKHTGEKPFVCGECGYRTPYKSSLYRHMQTHINHV